MKKILIMMSFVLFYSVAHAYTTPYLATQIGFHNTTVNTTIDGINFKDKGTTYGLGLGLNFSGRYRLEFSWIGRSSMHDNINIAWRDNYGALISSQTPTTISTDIFLLNAYRDVRLDEGTFFYFGFGAGTLHWKEKVTIGSYSFLDDGNDFTTAIHAGITGVRGEVVSVDMGLSWYHAFMHSGTGVDDIDNLIPHIGLRFNF